MNDYTICPAQLSDVDEISLIEEESFSHPWSKNAVVGSILDESTVFLVCKTAGNVVGYVSAQVLCPECYIGNLAVRKEYRKIGVGASLLRTVIQHAKNNQCDFVSLEVRVSNADAIRLYERHGFLKQGERKDYYTSPSENAGIYTLFFSESESI